MKTTTKLWIGLAVLALLSPLGLLLPAWFSAGDAWGEWGTETLREMVGYMPTGLQRLSSVLKTPLPDYAFSGAEEQDLARQGLAYILSALIGMAATAGAIMLLGRALARRERRP